ncbi:MAG: peptidyl-prolyl cis-trans isomerase [Bacteroidales bacterium]
MAVIGTIRRQSGLLIIIVGVALAAFVLGDFLVPGGGQRSVPSIAQVHGEDITYSQFDARFEQNLEFQKRNQNKEILTPEEMFQLRQQTFDQVVQKIVLDREYERLGLSVSSEELFDQIQGNNPHPYILQYFKDPETDQYKPELVRNYIAQLDQMDMTARKQWADFVDAIREDRLRSKYRNLISKGYFMPDEFLKGDFNEKKVQATVRLVGSRFNTIADTLVTVTDHDLKSYYEKYKHNYEQEASRDIDYVIFSVRPSAEDRNKVRENVNAVFQDFLTAENIPVFVNSESDKRYDSTFFSQGELPLGIDSIVFNAPVGQFVEPYLENDEWHMAKLMEIDFRPDSMKASHILIAFRGAFMADQEITRTRDAAKNLADSLASVIKATPVLMENLAPMYSDDPSAAQNAGDLGWFADGSMVFPFNQAVLTHKVGDVTVAESQFGYHVIKVTGKLDPVKKVRVAMISIAVTASQATSQNEFLKASEFQGKAVSMIAFDTLAANMGVAKRTATYLQAMGNRIAGIDYPRQIIQWAFIDGLKEGSVSHVFTMENDYIVAMLTKIREKGIPPLEDLKETLEPLVLNDLKGDLVVGKMQSLLKETSDLSVIAQRLNSQVDSVKNLTLTARNIAGYGNEPNLVAKVFAVEQGVVSGPVKGNNAAFIFRVDEIQEPDPSEDFRMYERQLLMNFTSKVSNNSYLQTLQDVARIVDNRVMFY